MEAITEKKNSKLSSPCIYLFHFKGALVLDKGYLSLLAFDPLIRVL